MNKYAVSVSVLLVAGVLAACNSEQGPSRGGGQAAALKEITGFATPESVLIHASGVYVSNLGAKPAPMEKDGDGFISKLTASGDWAEKRYFPKTGHLDAPKGMAVIGQVLYVADIDRVVGFDLATRETVFEGKVSETAFLNDLTVKDEHTLLASCTDSNRLVSLDVKSGAVTELAVRGALTGPNGVWYDSAAQTLYVVGMGLNNQPNGEVGAVDLAHQNQYTVLTSQKGMLDGLARLADGTLLFSDWVGFGPRGVIYRLDGKTHALTPLPLPLLAGPADFAYAEGTHTLWVPQMLANQVSLYSLSE